MQKPTALPPFVPCPWCADFDPADPRHRGASHGICATCREKIERSL